MGIDIGKNSFDVVDLDRRAGIGDLHERDSRSAARRIPIRPSGARTELPERSPKRCPSRST
jgi:hypothetical protein